MPPLHKPAETSGVTCIMNDESFVRHRDGYYADIRRYSEGLSLEKSIRDGKVGL